MTTYYHKMNDNMNMDNAIETLMNARIQLTTC
jgi:hypothetical protein